MTSKPNTDNAGQAKEGHSLALGGDRTDQLTNIPEAHGPFRVEKCQRHDPEPWRVEWCGQGHKIISKAGGVAETYANYPKERSETNAQRIVQCVNFCAGQSNKDLDEITRATQSPVDIKGQPLSSVLLLNERACKEIEQLKADLASLRSQLSDSQLELKEMTRLRDYAENAWAKQRGRESE